MAGRTAVLSVRIVSDSKAGILGLNRTANAVKNLQRAARNARADMTNFVGSTPKIAVAAAGVTTLAAAALAGTSNVLALGASLASVAGAALALPGVLAFGGVALGVLVAAMKDASTVLADLGPKFAALQDNISTNYWAQAAEPIRSLANSVLPTLNTALGNTARIMGSGMATAADTLKSSLAGALGPILSDINTGLHEANGAIAPFVQGMVTLTRVGAEYLPALGRGIADMGAAFGAWVASANAAGDLNRWIDNGILGLKDLGSIAGSTVGILGGLSTAAANAGGAGLGALADGMARVNEAVNGPLFQGALTTVFSGAHEAISNLMPGLESFGLGLAALSPTLASIMSAAGDAASTLLDGLGAVFKDPVFQNGAASAFNSIRDAVAGLRPSFDAIGPVLGTMAETFGLLAETWLPIVSDLFVALSPAIVATADALGPLITSLGTDLAAALEVVVPPLASFVETTLPGLIKAITPLTPVIIAFAAVWVARWAAMATIAMVNAVRMAAAWLIAMGPIGWITLAVIAIAVLVISKWDEIKAFTIAAWTVISNKLSDAWEWIKTAVATAISVVVSTVSDAWETVKGATTRAWDAVKSGLSSAWRSIKSAVSDGISRVVSTVRELPGRVTSALSSFASDMYSVGKDVIQGLINGISDMASSAVQAAKDVVGGAIDGAKRLLGIASPSRVFRKMGLQTGEGFVIGISKQRNAVQKATKDLLKVPQLTASKFKAPGIDMEFNGSSGGGQKGQTIHEHHYHFSVNGTVVDRLGTAEAIDGLLRERDRVMGGVAA